CSHLFGSPTNFSKQSKVCVCCLVCVFPSAVLRLFFTLVHLHRLSHKYTHTHTNTHTTHTTHNPHTHTHTHRYTEIHRHPHHTHTHTPTHRERERERERVGCRHSLRVREVN